MGSIWIIVSIVLAGLFIARRARRSSLTSRGRKEPWSMERRTNLPIEMIEGNSKRAVAAVGESHYRAAFEEICGPPSRAGERRKVVAQLVREPYNPYDPNAIAVYVEGRKVAHLSRDDAIAYGALVERIESRGRCAACTAVIRGGWARDGERADYGIWLDLPT